MSINVTPTSELDIATLNETDIANIVNAISAVVDLPNGKTWDQVQSFVFTITGTAGSLQISTKV